MRELILCLLLTLGGCDEGPTLYTPQFDVGEVAVMALSRERVMVVQAYCRHGYADTKTCIYGVRGQDGNVHNVKEFELEKQ